MESFQGIFLLLFRSLVHHSPFMFEKINEPTEQSEVYDKMMVGWSCKG